MASKNDTRSRSPKTAGNGNDTGDLDVQFLDVWAKLIEPKLHETSFEFEGEMQK